MPEYIKQGASCKDCSHYPVCEDKLFGSNHKNCRHFQNKADVVEVRHGEWEEHGNWFGHIEYKCTSCNDTIFDASGMDYCPWCGAKMDGKGEGG